MSSFHLKGAFQIKKEVDAVSGVVESQVKSSGTQREMDVNAYRKVTVRRPRRQKFNQKVRKNDAFFDVGCSLCQCVAME